MIMLPMNRLLTCVLCSPPSRSRASQMGQITENIVARNIYFTSLNTAGIGSALSNSTSGTGSLFASDQTAAELANQGLKYNYYWGMYSFCAGQGKNDDRSCSDRYIGYRWEPAQVLADDAQSTYSSEITTALGDSTFTDSHYLGLLSRVANVILLVGTILTGLAFLTGFLAHRFCFAFAALECLGAAGCLAVGSAIWTAIIYKAKKAIPDNTGVDIDYGNALWFSWASFAAVTLAIVPLIIACCVGRSKY